MTSTPGSLLLTLDAVASRMRWRRVQRLAGIVASTVFVTGSVMFALGAIVAPTGAGPWVRNAGLLVILGCIVALLLGARRGVSRLEAAEEADRTGALADELKSALWFEEASAERSAFVDAHRAKAESLAAGLDARKLVPYRILPSHRAAAVLLAVMVVVGFLSPRFTPHFGDGPSDASADAGRRSPAAQPGAAPGELAAIADANARDPLAKTLAALDDPTRTLEEKRKALEAAQQLAAQRALEAAASRERMKALAEALSQREGYEEVARALKDGDARQAAEALKSRLADGGGAGTDREESAEAAAAPDPAAVDALAEALQAATQTAPDDRTAAAQRNLAKAVQNLEDISKSIEATEALGRSARRLDAMTTELKREANLRAARFGERNGAGQAQSGPETGETNLKGGSMFRLGAVAQERRNPGKDNNRAGDASGNAQGDPVVGDEVRRIQAKYKRETVRDRETDEGGADSGKYAASRAAESKVAYRDVDSRYRRTGEEALSAERIALRHRAQVKGFFTDNGGSAQ